MFMGLSSMSMIETLFLFYYLNYLLVVYQLPGSVAGIILLISQAIHAAIGPLTIYPMDMYYIHSVGKHRTWMLGMLFPCVFSFMALWIVPNTSSIVLKSIYTLVMLTLFNFFYGFLYVAYEGIMPLLESKPDDLVVLNSYRLAMGTCLSIIPALAGIFIIPVFGTKSATGYILVASIVAFTLIVTYLSFVLFTREEDVQESNTSMKHATIVEGLNSSSKKKLNHDVEEGTQQDEVRPFHIEPAAADEGLRDFSDEEDDDVEPTTVLHGTNSVKSPTTPIISVPQSQPSPAPNNKSAVQPVALFGHSDDSEESKSAIGSSAPEANWLQTVLSLLKEKIFLAAMFNTMFLWSLEVFTASTTPFFIQDYLKVNLAVSMFDPTFIAFFCTQLGHTLTQFMVGALVKKMSVEVLLRIAIGVLIVLKSLSFFLFDYISGVYFVIIVLLDALCMGVFNAAFEIMVVEVCIALEFKSKEAVAYENIIFGMNNGFRETSMAISFLINGIILEGGTEVGIKLCYSGIPMIILGLVIAVQVWQPDIMVMKTLEKKILPEG